MSKPLIARSGRRGARGSKEMCKRHSPRSAAAWAEADHGRGRAIETLRRVETLANREWICALTPVGDTLSSAGQVSHILAVSRSLRICDRHCRLRGRPGHDALKQPVNSELDRANLVISPDACDPHSDQERSDCREDIPAGVAQFQAFTNGQIDSFLIHFHDAIPLR